MFKSDLRPINLSFVIALSSPRWTRTTASSEQISPLFSVSISCSIWPQASPVIQLHNFLTRQIRDVPSEQLSLVKNFCLAYQHLLQVFLHSEHVKK